MHTVKRHGDQPAFDELQVNRAGTGPRERHGHLPKEPDPFMFSGAASLHETTGGGSVVAFGIFAHLRRKSRTPSISKPFVSARLPLTMVLRFH